MTFAQMLSALERVLLTYTEPELRHAVITVEPGRLRRHAL
jgi:hypothetical protein